MPKLALEEERLPSIQIVARNLPKKELSVFQT